MRTVKDFGANLLITLGVVGVSAWLESALKDHPVYVLAGIGITMFLALQVSFWWQGKRLAKRLNIQKERWGKLEEQRMKLREPHRNCLEIPNLLSELNDMSTELVKQQTLVGIPQENWNKAKMHAKTTIGIFNQLAVVLVLRNTWLGKLLKLDRWCLRLLLHLGGVLKELGVGGLMADQNEVYANKLKAIRNMMRPLPPKITQLIEGNIALSKALDSAYILEIAKSALSKWNINLQSQFIIRFNYWVTGSNMMLSQSYGRISESIENYLVGK